ncbi:AtpZ/AtpI family protein [Caldanaerovirga acetigignens]|uniref:AtpZ/AtpI family protein n=1 Tax=Caldanaerovirga acetigignens TaxID=447595 RepID=UPI0009334E47|nr:AtpZ/AtpI family protein [Caldanaerovirga acetigignens]
MKDIRLVQHIALLTQIGLNMALPILGGVYFGAYLDRRLSSGSLFLILGVLLGAFSGAMSVYKLLTLEFKKKK